MSGTASSWPRAALASLAGLLMAQAPPPSPPATPEADEIVVVASPRHDCRLRFAERTMTDREFNARATEWAAGKPLRVVLPASAGKDCMVKIGMRLFDRGVKLVEFVDVPDPPAATPQSSEAPATPR